MAEQDLPSPDADDPSGLARVRELLPWYAMGALPVNESAFIDQWLAAAPAHTVIDLQAEIAWLRGAAIAARESVPEARLDAGWDMLSQRIAAEAPSTRNLSATRPTPRGPSWLQGRIEALSNWLAPRGAGFAMGAAAVILVQAGVIGAMLLRTPAEQEPLSGVPAINVPSGSAVLTVAFRAGVAESDLRGLLLQNHAEIVSGPSALGLYRIAVPAAEATAALAAFAAAGTVVESVQREP